MSSMVEKGKIWNRILGLILLVIAIGTPLYFWLLSPSPRPKADPVRVISVPGNSISLPLPGAAPVRIDFSGSNTVTLQKSRDGILSTLVEISNKEEIKPIGRSYSGLDWELYSGDLSTSSISCGATACRITLLSPSKNHTYVLTSFDHSLTAENEAARFLEKTTFGPTRSEIAAFRSPLDWVQNQFDLPATSHRQFYRERATHWQAETTYHGLVSTHPCSKDARYRNFAFLFTDRERYVTIETRGAKRILSVNGQFRTIVDSVKEGDATQATTEVPDGK